MGLIKKIFRPVRKIAKKIIPKEIRPALPFLAAYYGPAAFAKEGIFSNKILTDALLAAGTAAATDEDADLARVAALAAAPEALSQGLGNVASRIDPNLIADSDSFVQVGDMAAKTAGTLSRASEGIKGASALKTIGAQTAVDQAAKFAEIRQDEIDAYNANLLEQGVQDKTKRRAAIFGIYKNAGYDDDYVNNMLDRYGYDDGGEVPGKGKKTGIEKALERLNKKKDDDEDTSKNLAGGLMAAAQGVEKAFGRGFGEMEPVPMLRFARGGEVEIEEQADDLGIMDLMRDQGVEYGEQVSVSGPFDDYDDIAMQLFGKGYKDLTPEEMELMQEELERLMNKFRSRKDDRGIMQMASGYKDDIDEMYEQYVFEMEEQGLQPMSFSQFLARERAGMAGGGSAGSRYSFLINKQKQGILSPDEEQELLMLEMTYADDSQGKADGGKVKRRKKGEPADEIIETEEEIFIDKMPRPKRQGIMEAADGGRIGFTKGGDVMKAVNRGIDPAEALDLLKEYKRMKRRFGLDISFEDYLSGDMAKGGIAGMADGGIMEKDMRGGGFIPEGTKEKADDVPARLSKNEFVMTADAVRAAGGGSVNKGAKRMYDMMYSLEGKV